MNQNEKNIPVNAELNNEELENVTGGTGVNRYGAPPKPPVDICPSCNKPLLKFSHYSTYTPVYRCTTCGETFTF